MHLPCLWNNFAIKFLGLVLVSLTFILLCVCYFVVFVTTFGDQYSFSCSWFCSLVCFGGWFFQFWSRRSAEILLCVWAWAWYPSVFGRTLNTYMHHRVVCRAPSAIVKNAQFMSVSQYLKTTEPQPMYHLPGRRQMGCNRKVGKVKLLLSKLFRGGREIQEGHFHFKPSQNAIWQRNGFTYRLFIRPDSL